MIRLSLFNPIALRKAKIIYNFGLSECHRVKVTEYTFREDDTSIFFTSLLREKKLVRMERICSSL